MFFEILNKPHKNREESFQSSLFKDIPYLNGGLFSPQKEDYYKSKSEIVNVPDSWLRNLTNLLESYHFTVDENTSFDIDLSIDPEMLGRIFENLLARINPETGETVRKSTGSFYTPREIVDYMVDESLSQYLSNKTHIDQNRLNSLISYNLDDDSLYKFDNIEKINIVKALSKVKILDPACGSGAFPIGILQKIVFILQRIDVDAQFWFENQISNTPPEVRHLIEREFKNKNFDYIRKLGVIRESIFGVDIQPIATEIARLRCFLTLIVDERIVDEKPNRGIYPLPNLDFKFVTANTLINLNISNKARQHQIGFFEDVDNINELKEIRDEYFNSHNSERDSLKLRFSQAQNRMLQNMLTHHRHGFTEITQRLSIWDPFSHKATDWFDSDWFFGLPSFNIVIGNPPYVQLQKNSGLLANIYEAMKFETFNRSGDIYGLFYEQGVNLLSEGGLLCYISSNKWMRTSYGSKLREFFIKFNPVELIDFAGFQVFETAAVDTTILLLQKQNNQNNLKAVHFKNDYSKEMSIRDYFALHETNLTNLDKGTWFIGDSKMIDLKNKIESVGTQLRKWDGLDINYGIKTGANDVFIVDQNFKEKLEDKEPKAYQVVKPLLRGLHTQNYNVNWVNDYLLYIPWHFPLGNTVKKGPLDEAENLFRSNYPVLYEYFLENKDRLLKRNKAETGIRYEWYALQRSGSSYKEDFLKYLP